MSAEQPQQQQPMAQTQTPAASTPAAAPANSSPIKDDDVKIWSTRANDILARPSEHINSSSSANAQSWFAGFFDCFNPIDSCLVTCCVPCVTFGKTFHRMHHDSELQGYEPVNTSCLLMCGAGCVGCFCVPIAVQSQMIREKYNLEGSCLGDLAKAWCCGCCSLIQQDKEVEYRESLLRQSGGGGAKEQYQPATGMAYPAQ